MPVSPKWMGEGGTNYQADQTAHFIALRKIASVEKRKPRRRIGRRVEETLLRVEYTFDAIYDTLDG